MHRTTPTALLAALALACGSGAQDGPAIRAFAAVVEWRPALELALTVEAPGADLAAIHYAWVRPDGTVIGREALLLDEALGDQLQGQRSITATRVVGTGGFLPPVRVRLRAVDTAGRSASAFADVLHPAFGEAGAACAGSAQPCAGELACQGSLCALASATSAVCQASAAPVWTAGVAAVPVPGGAASAVVGTCWPLEAAGTATSLVTLDAPAGEHLAIELPLGAVAMLRTACEAPASEFLCLTGSAGLDLEPGSYTLLVAGTATAAPGAVVRLTRSSL